MPTLPTPFFDHAHGLTVSIQEAGIEGIMIGDAVHVLSQFADDTTLLLRNWAELRKVEAPLQKWCDATAMRENAAKREGLAMGSYRRKKAPRDLRKIAWAPEGGWVKSLGVLIGNDLDHAKFWKQKLQATRDKANRWAGLFTSSYFGRNLIVQGMYFGRLRYWLYSVFMNKHMITSIQQDADRLWWSRDPVLDGNSKRIRRFVAHRTATGPRQKGGMGNMSWKDHVDAVLAKWVLRYMHPAESAWKNIWDEFLLRDNKGNDKYGCGRGILMTKMTSYQKFQLLRRVPKNAVYLRACLHAHWRIRYTQDLEN